MHDEAAQTRIQTICLMILATTAIMYAIYWLRPVLVPFVIAVFVVSGIAPVLDMLQRRLRVNRLVAAGIAFVAGLLVLLLLGGTLWASTIELRESAPAYRQRIQELLRAAEDLLPPALTGSTGLSSSLDNPHAPFSTDSVVREAIGAVSSSLFDLATTSVVVLIYVFFLLLGATESTRLAPTWIEIDGQIREYLRVKTVISLLTGLVFGGVLALLGIPMATTFGVLAFLLNYIPNIGPLIATVLPIPLIVFHPEAGMMWMTAAILLAAGVQFISGNVIEPQLMGDSTDLHPIVVLLALMFWGMMWGIVGMFLATPITAGIRIVLEKLDATRPLADLLAGRTFAKTPAPG